MKMASRAVLLLGAGLLLLAVSVSGLRRESVVAKGKEALLVRQQNPEGRFDFAHPTKKKKTCAVGCNATADWTCKSASTALQLSIGAGIWGMDRFYYGYIFGGLIKMVMGLIGVCGPIASLAVVGWRASPKFDPINGQPTGMCAPAVKLIKIDGADKDSKWQTIWIVDPYAYLRAGCRCLCSCSTLGFLAWFIYDAVSISSGTLLPAANPRCLVT